MTHVADYTIARFEVRPFGRRRTSRSQAQQHPRKWELWPEDLWFWLGPYSRPTDDWLCLDKILQSTRNHAHLAKIWCRGRYLECRLHLRGDVGRKAAVPRKRSCQPIFNHHGASRYTARRCHSHYCQRKCKEMVAFKSFSLDTKSPVDIKIRPILAEAGEAAIEGQVQKCGSSR